VLAVEAAAGIPERKPRVIDLNAVAAATGPDSFDPEVIATNY
jgi:hypothetical protein